MDMERRSIHNISIHIRIIIHPLLRAHTCLPHRHHIIIQICIRQRERQGQGLGIPLLRCRCRIWGNIHIHIRSASTTHSTHSSSHSSRRMRRTDIGWVRAGSTSFLLHRICSSSSIWRDQGRVRMGMVGWGWAWVLMGCR